MNILIGIIILILALSVVIFEFFVLKKRSKKKDKIEVPDFNPNAQMPPISIPQIKVEAPPVAHQMPIAPPLKPEAALPPTPGPLPVIDIKPVKTNGTKKHSKMPLFVLLVLIAVSLVSIISFTVSRPSQQGLRLTESKPRAAPVPTDTPTPIPTQAEQLALNVSPTVEPVTPTDEPSPSVTSKPSKTPTPSPTDEPVEVTATAIPERVEQLPESGWSQYSLILFGIAAFVIFISFLY